jgi:hypothetical protein
MRVGLTLPHYDYSFGDSSGPISFSRVAEVAADAERQGFDSVWVSDHFFATLERFGGDDTRYGALEPLTTLAGRRRSGIRLSWRSRRRRSIGPRAGGSSSAWGRVGSTPSTRRSGTRSAPLGSDSRCSRRRSDTSVRCSMASPRRSTASGSGCGMRSTIHGRYRNRDRLSSSEARVVRVCCRSRRGTRTDGTRCGDGRRRTMPNAPLRRGNRSNERVVTRAPFDCRLGCSRSSAKTTTTFDDDTS